MELKFREKLRFFQWWNLIAILGISSLFLFLVYGQISQTGLSENGKNGILLILSVGVVGLVLFVGLLIYILFQLKTEMDEKEIKVNFTPFINKTIKWTDINSAEIVTCNVFAEWALKGWKRYGVYRNKKGNKALALVLNNGKKYLIGTQKQTELARILEKMPVANNTYSK